MNPATVWTAASIIGCMILSGYHFSSRVARSTRTSTPTVPLHAGMICLLLGICGVAVADEPKPNAMQRREEQRPESRPNKTAIPPALSKAMLGQQLNDVEIEVILGWLQKCQAPAKSTLIVPTLQFDASVPKRAVAATLGGARLSDAEKIRLLEWVAYSDDSRNDEELRIVVRRVIHNIPISEDYAKKLETLLHGPKEGTAITPDAPDSAPSPPGPPSPKGTTQPMPPAPRT